MVSIAEFQLTSGGSWERDRGNPLQEESLVDYETHAGFSGARSKVINKIHNARQDHSLSTIEDLEQQ